MADIGELALKEARDAARLTALDDVLEELSRAPDIDALKNRVEELKNDAKARIRGH